MQTILVARLRPDAILPTRKHPEDAGMDFYAVQDALIPPAGQTIVPTGITIEIAAGYVGLLKPKGGNNHLLGAGVVDAGYQGEILIKVFNPLNTPLQIKKGAAIGQMLIIAVETPAIQEVDMANIHQKSSHRLDGGGIVTQYKS